MSFKTKIIKKETMQEVIKLPWPPSVNQAYRIVGFLSKNYSGSKPLSKIILSKAGRDYIKYVKQACAVHQYKRFGNRRLDVRIDCFAADNRKRDLGNLDKILMDSLEKAGVFDSDSQIDKETFIRQENCKYANGNVVVTITEKAKDVDLSCSCVFCKKN